MYVVLCVYVVVVMCVADGAFFIVSWYSNQHVNNTNIAHSITTWKSAVNENIYVQ